MATKFDIEDRWPELFVQLDETQRRAVVQSLASAWHEGWTPNREDVENLTDEARGATRARRSRTRLGVRGGRPGRLAADRGAWAAPNVARLPGEPRVPVEPWPRHAGFRFPAGGAGKWCKCATAAMGTGVFQCDP